LHFWSVFGDDLVPTLEKEEEKYRPVEEDEDSSLAGMPRLSNINRWEDDSSDEESDSEDAPPHYVAHGGGVK
jgi:hypothetical protein